MIDTKPLHIRFDKIDGFIQVYDGTRYLVLFGSEKYDFIYKRIRYLYGSKKWYYNYGKIKVDSHDSLPLEKILTFHNDIIHNMSVWNKNKNHCYYIRRKMLLSIK